MKAATWRIKGKHFQLCDEHMDELRAKDPARAEEFEAIPPDTECWFCGYLEATRGLRR